MNTIVANKALVRRYYNDLFNTGNLDAADELFADGFVMHEAPPGVQGGRDGIAAVIQEWRSGFPDIHEEVEELVAEGDLVSARFHFTGTHTGSFFGQAATNGKGSMTGMEMFRVRDGQITDLWYAEKLLEMFIDLGVVDDLLAG